MPKPVTTGIGAGSPEDVVEPLLDALLDDDLESLYEQAPCGFISTSPDGMIIRANETFLRWTGYDRDEVVGHRSFASLLAPGGRIFHETHYAPMLAMQGRVRELALDIVCRDGRRLATLVNSVLEHAADGTPLVIRTVIFDATERRAYERELLFQKERAERSEAKASMLASTLQRTLIPPAPPPIQHLEVATFYRPAGLGDEVGGDFYDVFEIVCNDWAVAIGDVCGKGIDAAIVTSLARHTIRAATVMRPSPADVLQALNTVLQHDLAERFCSVAMLRLIRQDDGWNVTSCLAGHPWPVLIRNGCAPVAVGTSGTLIGVTDTPTLTDSEIRLEPGDVLVLYTDGVTEARSGDEFFGDERMLEALALDAHDAHTIGERLLTAVLDFQGGVGKDDIAIVVLRVP